MEDSPARTLAWASAVLSMCGLYLAARRHMAETRAGELSLPVYQVPKFAPQSYAAAPTSVRAARPMTRVAPRAATLADLQEAKSRHAPKYRSTLEGKKALVSEVSELLDSSQMIFQIPSEKLTVVDLSTLRSKMPEGSTAKVVKNTLMQRACEAEWSAVNPLLEKSSLWFFVGENIKETVDVYDQWRKELSEAKKEKLVIGGGVVENSLVDKDGVIAVSKLPTKKDLMCQLAVALNNAGAQGLVGTLANMKGNPKSVAVRLKEASGSKLARAVKLGLATEQN